MKKIEVLVCHGTTCCVMGGGEIFELERALPPQMRAQVNISISPCLGACGNRNYGKAPFVKIDNELIDNASLEKITKIVKLKLSGKEVDT